MTLHATRNGQKITIHHSPSDTHVEEDAQHVGQFYNQLGSLLQEAERELVQQQEESSPEAE